jgi:S-formylglutathione hydrolase FrmB
MRRTKWPLLLLVIFLTGTARAQEPGRAPAPAVESVSFDAPSVGRTMKFNIALPASYEKDSEKRYLVLYMLHGLTSNYLAWNALGAPRAARRYDLIVVMADAGNSWYVNWAESEDGQKNNWEDYIVKDLVDYVDTHFRTIASRDGRAITGLSMGGYGALMLGLRHPDMFCSIGSESGAVGFARMATLQLRAGRQPGNRRIQSSNIPNPRIGIEGFSSQAERTPKGKIFLTAEQAEAYDPFALILKVPVDKLPHIYIDCGTEDRLIEGNREFAKLLMQHDVPFTFSQSPGGHLPRYWMREVGHDIAVQFEILKRSHQSEQSVRDE